MTTPLTLTAEAKAWLEAHKGWDAGMKPEVEGVSTEGRDTLRAPERGHQHRPGSGPQAQTPWWRNGHSTAVGAGAPLGQICTGLSTDGIGQQPTRGTNTEYRTPTSAYFTEDTTFGFATAPVYPEVEAYTPVEPMPARVARMEIRALRPTTAVFGQNVRSFFIMKHAQNHRRSDGLRIRDCFQSLIEGEAALGYVDTSIEDADTTRTTLKAIYTRLNDRQRLVAELLIEGRTQRYIAQVLGVSQPAVVKQLRSIRKALV